MSAQLREDLGEIWIVPVDDLLSYWNSFAAWTRTPVERAEIERAIEEGRSDPRPYDTMPIGPDDPCFRRYHVERIAWLVIHPDPSPVCIDVGAPSLGWHPTHGDFDFIDGNHRVCAAAYRGDPTIRVSYGGECDTMPALFPAGVVETTAATASSIMDTTI